MKIIQNLKIFLLKIIKNPNGLLRCVLLGAVSTVFLAVYATLTWFTTVSGVNKLFNSLGATPDTLLAHVIAMICTSTTMVVNTFSQVYKVFNPKTYVDLKENLNQYINHQKKTRQKYKRSSMEPSICSNYLL